ncbi:DUF6153 family protein [uncultured Microbacterium sp.]|uniref:DUF6153 family protein n=1 Tax=uncultured Microbacterium sp. TaxID=191216 RepID=UPI002625807F|nr:DUF6153 family protein [uncultured Microbacterium sp.]
MLRIRSHERVPSVLRRLLVLVPVALAIITGLLGMHTLTGSHASPTAETTMANVHSAGVAPATSVGGAGAAAMEEGSSAGHCAGDCSYPAGMPDHSMLMMVCVLALLAAVIILLAPTALALLAYTLARAHARGRSLLARLPHPRPPSLIVLSISRT